jgi:5-methylcytosine-specific restriction endonuclease McrA
MDKLEEKRAKARKRVNKYRESHPEIIKARNLKYRIEHREKSRQLQKDWRERNPEYHKTYYSKNKQYWTEWREKNRDSRNASNHKRRTNKLASKDTHTAEDRLLLFEKYNGLCIYCGNEAKTIDHLIPLSRGGSNGVENLAPACLSCNSSKGAKTYEEYT